VVVAWTSFAAEGIERVIVKGDRLRGDDPAVKAAPWGFVVDGTPEGESPNVFDGVVERQEAENPRPQADVHLPDRPREFDGLIMTLNRPLRVSFGNDGKGGPAEVVELKEGVSFLAADELVSALPQAFDAPRGRGLRSKPTP
jgi:hypothetical protein